MDETIAADRLRESWTRYYHEARRPRECLFCPGRKTWWNGRRMRSGTGVFDERVVTVARFPCRRVRCASCRGSWSLLPPGLLPGRHFDVAVGVRALAHYLFTKGASLKASARACLLSSRTLGRFRDWVAGLVAPATLQQLVADSAGTPILGKVLLVVDSARKAKDAARRAVLLRAAEVVCLAESLAAASGLAGPGLSALVFRAVRGRRALALQQGASIPADAWRRAAGVRESMTM